jgi:carbon-monoxide dehydrogenase small subunit
VSLKVEIGFTLNGVAVRTETPPEASALWLLREKLDLTGAKLACGEGECGACTIVVDDLALNACLMPAVDLDGRDVLTIEGLWRDSGLDAMQQTFIEKGAVQCGFCTPGMILQARQVMRRNPKAGAEEIRRGLEGNVCRCTGYTKIVDAVIAAARRMTAGASP